LKPRWGRRSANAFPPEEVLQALRMIGFAQLREHEIYPYHYVIEVRSEEDQ